MSQERDEAVAAASETVRRILAAIKSLRYGSLEITVHDGRVVQIERKEKMRLARKGEEE
jgi:hypothetical protein